VDSPVLTKGHTIP